MSSSRMGADPPNGTILVFNAGSSSLKFALFAGVPALGTLMRGEVTGLGENPHLVAHDAAGVRVADQQWSETGEQAFSSALDGLLALVEAMPGHDRLAAVGHRIVHGGADHIAPELVTQPLLAALETLFPLDPIHMPHNLAPIRALAKARPDLSQVACFDTAFHHTMPRLAQHFALPRAITDAGVRRYGFHGLSYEYIACRLAADSPALANGRVIVAHLGAGASLCALDKCVSIATTFGMSVLDGLMMATRCGSLDPGAILYLLRLGHQPADIEDMLYNRSGLLGVSGISSDIRVLLASKAPQAREAIDLFTYRVALDIGAMTSALGGLDGIVFTAGIGEHAPAIRTAVCERLQWLGLALDEAANDAGSSRISMTSSKIDVRVMATDEEAMIAHHSLAITCSANVARASEPTG
ncbi:acetate/propionate family kinase [Sphingobium sp. D43FB]|uniref:acetate/propionate family kinase n=1 Tax=Sphingobium sp. D43FB TaxID=2017595 RepID=UPI0020D05FB8|nr:acetate/propionate family kinase [Sphingobium sp. D43FB]